jgi:hypothetical protein
MEKSLLHISHEEAQENEARRLKAESALDKAEALIETWFEAYSEGEMTFDNYCRYVYAALSAKNIEPYARQKKLGGAIESALKAKPPKRTRTNKRFNTEGFVKVCRGLVKLVGEYEKLPITRMGNTQTAFERVAELLQNLGVKQATKSTVERNYMNFEKDRAVVDKKNS